MTIIVVRSRQISRLVALVAGLSLLLGFGVVTTASASAPTSAPPRGSSATAPLTNVSHLNFLLDTVPLHRVAAHTTYQTGTQPTAHAPCVYADRNADREFRRVSGGALPTTTPPPAQRAFRPAPPPPTPLRARAP